MHTIAEARALAIEKLKEAHVDSPALTADLLIGFVLGWDRARVLAHSEKVLGPDEADRLQNLVDCRATGEPYHYLTGEKEFYGLAFKVTPDVLIPRPETEILVEKALELIREKAPSPVRFVDAGTGSGCIAVSIAYSIPDSTGYAVDISGSALRIARENIMRHRVADRIMTLRADLLECFPCRPCLDMVISNPPYIRLDDYNGLAADVREYEPRLALLSGVSGYEIYRRLIPESMRRLVSGGHLLLELGAGQAVRVEELARKEGFVLEAIINDLQGIPRCLVGRKPARRNNG
jgi:release factor glutamine methyltransferase